MEIVTSSLENLKIQCQNEENISEADAISRLTPIIEILNVEDGDRKATTEKLLENSVLDVLTKFLSNSGKVPTAVIAKACEVIAEIAKSETGRKPCSELSILKPLVLLIPHEDHQVVVQACRALGNICYENDIARGIVKDENGVGKLIHLLQRLLTMKVMPEKLRTVASGCLLNLTDTYEETQEQALQAGIVEVLLQYLQRFYSQEEIATHCLLVLNCLADFDNGRTRLMETSALASLLEVLDKDFSGETLDSLLELMGNLAENDNVKLQLARCGFCEKLLKLIERHLDGQGNKDDEVNNLSKTMCDLIILVLTGDGSMELLYQDGKGKVYKETLGWLRSTNESLHVAAALAAGNFARNDSHCIQMVSDGVAENILNLLQKHSGLDGDIRFQHAALSALRNLAIPAANKEALIQIGVVDRLLPMTAIETFPVVFKLLGTLRMLIDKQEELSKRLGQDQSLVKRLVTWCSTDDHPGVRGEAIRMLSWLVKNSCSSDVMRCLRKEGALPHLVTMVASEHIVMQNEALLAMTLMSATLLSEMEADLIALKVWEPLQQRLQEGNVPEIILNALAFLKTLIKSSTLKKSILSLGMDSDIEKLQKTQNATVVEECRNVLSMLQDNNSHG